MFGDMLRTFILTLTLKTNWARRLSERAIFTEVGITGYISLYDRTIAKDKGLKKLNRFEKWLLAPSIEEEKARRRNKWREALFARGVQTIGEEV